MVIYISISILAILVIFLLLYFKKPKQLPKAKGEFGLVATNPIPIKKGESLGYLKTLADKEGNFVELREEILWSTDYEEEMASLGLASKDFTPLEGLEKYTVTKGKLEGVELFLIINENYRTSKRTPKVFSRNSHTRSIFLSEDNLNNKGLDINHPIITSILGGSFFIHKLRSENGEKIKAVNKGEYLPENFDDFVEEYEIIAGEKMGTKLYFTKTHNSNDYLLSIEDTPPKGFIFSSDIEEKKLVSSKFNHSNTATAKDISEVNAETQNRQLFGRIESSLGANSINDNSSPSKSIFYDQAKLSHSTINHLGTYHKYNHGNNPNFNSYSRKILELKKGKNAPINDFHLLCSDWLNADFDTIVIVPSHDPSNKHSGIRTLAVKLAKTKGWNDGTACLERTYKIGKLSDGGDRSMAVHLSSISVVDKLKIHRKKVLLLDDVTTSGNSLKVSKKILSEAGAARVYMCALGQTSKY